MYDLSYTLGICEWSALFNIDETSFSASLLLNYSSHQVSSMLNIADLAEINEIGANVKTFD